MTRTFDEARALYVQQRKYTGPYTVHCVDGVEKVLEFPNPTRVPIRERRTSESVIALDDQVASVHSQSTK